MTAHLPEHREGADATLTKEEFRREVMAILPQLRAFARGICGNRDLADDLAQEAYDAARKAYPDASVRTELDVLAADNGLVASN